MKKLLLSVVLFFVTICCYSQICLTTWPYVYSEFQEATIYATNGSKFQGKINIHVRKSTLHYLEGDKIKETNSEDILLVIAGDDKYMCVKGQIMKVLGSDETGFVATLILANFNKLTETGGAYGSSSTSSSTRKLSSLEMDGNVKMNHMDLLSNKENGVPLVLSYSYYLVTNGSVYEANRRGIASKLSPEAREQFKIFLKDNIIQWRDPQSLLILLKFFNKN